MEQKITEFSKEEIVELLTEIGNLLPEVITLFMIGGGNMSLKGIKAITKDIDLIVLSKQEYGYLKLVLTGRGYYCHEEMISDDFYKIPIIIFTKGDRRIDLFIKNVCSQLELTDEMQQRSQEYLRFNNLKVRLVSNEDIFLFKPITNREKDVDDCRILIAEGLDWELIKQELHRQEGKALWRFWVYEQSCRIRNKYGAVIPKRMVDYIWNLVQESWLEQPRDFMEGIADEQFHRELNRRKK